MKKALCSVKNCVGGGCITLHFLPDIINFHVLIMVHITSLVQSLVDFCEACILGTINHLNSSGKYKNHMLCYLKALRLAYRMYVLFTVNTVHIQNIN